MEQLLAILGALAAVLGWLLVVLLGLLLLVLLVPAHARASGWVRLEGDERDGADGAFRAAWGFGLVGVAGSLRDGVWLRMLGLRVKRLLPGRAARATEGKPRREREMRAGRGGAWFWRHRRTLLGAGRRLLGTLHLAGALRGELGLGDPADTALAEGLLRALARTGLAVEVRCDYLEERLALAGDLRLRVWPAEILAAALGLLFRRELRAALRDKA